MSTFRLLLLAGLAACNLSPKPIEDDTGTTGGDDTSGGDDTATDDGRTIQDVRDGTVADGESVTLRRVLVSSPLTRDGEGFFIQDPAGGARSGLYVFSYDSLKDLYLEEGDEITITGTVQEFYDWTEFVIGGAQDVEKTGTGTLPDPIDLGSGADVDWDDYESVPVVLTEQTIESVDDYGAGALSAGIRLDDGFLLFEPDLTCRSTYTSLTGIIFYEYEEWSLNPREDTELAGYTAGEPLAATVLDLQGGEVCGPVTLTDVVLTSEFWDDEGDGYAFVQDQGGGSYTGIQIFLSEFTATGAIGDTVTVSGAATEFYGFTQLRVSAEEDLKMTGTSETVSDTLGEVPEDWEAWEGCLVTLTDVEVTSEMSYGQVETNWDIAVDDLLFDFEAGTGTTWDAVTGVVYYSYEEWKIEPRSASDFE